LNNPFFDFLAIWVPTQTIRSPDIVPVRYFVPNDFKLVNLSLNFSSPVPKVPHLDVGGPPLVSYQTLKCLTPAVANSVSVLISISVIGFPSPFWIASYFPVFVSKIATVWSTSRANATKISPEGEKLKL